MKKFIFMVLIVIMATPSNVVHADVVYSNYFFGLNMHATEKLGRSFQVYSPLGSVSTRAEPGRENTKDVNFRETTYRNGDVVEIGYTYSHEGEYWGIQPLSHRYSPPGWIQMENLRMLYTKDDFEREHRSEFYTYISFKNTELFEKEFVLWQWPGSDRPKQILGDNYYFTIIDISVIHAYKDKDGREWGYVHILVGNWFFRGYYFDPNGWVCLSDPQNPDIPAFFPAPEPIKWSPGIDPDWRPAYTPLSFSISGACNIPAGAVRSPILPVYVSDGVYGGEGSYAFTKVGTWPDWLVLAEDGTISGSRPPVAQAPTTITLKISDNSGACLFISLDVGSVWNTYSIIVENGNAVKHSADEGELVTITAKPAPIGQAFEKWVSDEVAFIMPPGLPPATVATFTMPGKNVAVTAVYKDLPVSTAPSIESTTMGATDTPIGQDGGGGGGFNPFWPLVGGGALVALCLLVFIWRKR